VRQQELDHFRNKISAEEYELLEEFSKRLIKKLQHNPIIHLRKSAASNKLRSEDLDLVIKLHGLLDEDS
jgi:glutamyl-tRNA reductase